MTIPVHFAGQSTPTKFQSLVVLDKAEMVIYFKQCNPTSRAMMAIEKVYKYTLGRHPNPQLN